MSTVTAPSTDVERPAYRVTGPRVLRSEWAKLWSLRSTWITLGLGLAFLVTFGLIAAAQYTPQPAGSGAGMEREFANATTVSLSLFGLTFAQLALGVLGVLVTAGEYSTGMIRSTLAAVPSRLPTLWAKAAVFGVVALVLGVIGVFVTFLIAGPYLPSNAGQSMYALTHDSSSLSPAAGLLVFLGWTALALAGAAYRLRRTDA
jgi:ABC-2 type transport system permease protein